MLVMLVVHHFVLPVDTESYMSKNFLSFTPDVL